MKFRGRMIEVSAIRQFYDILNTMAKLAKVCVLRLTSTRLYFIVTDLSSSGTASAMGGPCVWCDIDHSHFFQDYCLEGVTKEENEIYLELEPDKLARNLSVLKSSASTARSLKLKLTRKHNSPCLSFEIELCSLVIATTAPALDGPTYASGNSLRHCTHDIPVTIIPRKHWSDFKEPVVQKFDVSIYLPDLKRLKHIAERYKSLDHTVVLQANRSGELRFKLDNDRVTVDTSFKHLDVPSFANNENEGNNVPSAGGNQIRLAGNVPASQNMEAGNNYQKNRESLFCNVRVELKKLLLYLSADHIVPKRILANFVESKLIHLFLVHDNVFPPKRNFYRMNKSDNVYFRWRIRYSIRRLQAHTKMASEHQGEDGDVVLILDDNIRLTCQRTLLSKSSPYFSAMFTKGFAESNKEEIRLHGISRETMETLIAYAGAPHSKSWNDYSLGLTEGNVINMLQASGMLHFDSIRQICCEYLLKILSASNALHILVETDHLAELEVRDVALHTVLWNFEEATSVQTVLDETPLHILTLVLKHPHLHTKSEFLVFIVINKWLECDLNERTRFCLSLLKCLRIDDISIEDLNYILKFASVNGNSEATNYINTVLEQKQNADIADSNSGAVEKLNPRVPPIFPCVVGRVNPKKDGKINQKGFITNIFVFKNKEVLPYLSLQDAPITPSNVSPRLMSSLNAQGNKIISNGPLLYVTGGELVLGKNNWNKVVWKYDTITSKWDAICEIDDPRRHHSVCLSDDTTGIYLVGGFGGQRKILERVDYLCAETRKVTECPALPVSVYSPAVCHFRGRFFVIKSQMFVYSSRTKLWSKVSNIVLPTHMEFTCALVHQDYIYLTGNHAYELYRLNPDHIMDEDCVATDASEATSNAIQKRRDTQLELVGKFANEAQNVCVVGNTIYNFSTDQFDYKSAIETYDLETGQFSVVWEKDAEDFDFSPYHSSGCFPLVIY